MTKTATHTTENGWTIAPDQTPARVTARQIRLHGSLQAVANILGQSVDVILRRLQDDKLPPPPVVPADVMVIMSKPVVSMDKPNADRKGNACLMRQCDHALRVLRDYRAVDATIESTRYTPPAAYLAKREALGDAVAAAQLGAAAIPARTARGIRAKALLIAAFLNPECDSLDDQPLVTSLLADCTALQG